MKQSEFSVLGQYVDLEKREIYGAEIYVSDKKIHRIEPRQDVPDVFILPGFINAHVHIESSMLTPSEFSKAVIPTGTVAVVSDPHEIANVNGVEGVKFMIEDQKQTPLKVFFGAPSCVPATSFESSGANLNSESIRDLFENENLFFLSEMMNFPGVVYSDPEVMKKLQIAKEYKKPIDGHAPGLSGEQLAKYIQSGISTDHECTSISEAIEKIKYGMTIQIREGSAAKNFEALSSLIDSHPDHVMLCTDDSHPDDLLKGHMNLIVKRAIEKGYNLFNILRAASYNSVKHYNLPVGLLQLNDPADFVIIDSFEELNVLSTVINGEFVFHDNQLNFTSSSMVRINNFDAQKIKLEDIAINDAGRKIRIITAKDGDLVTSEIHDFPKVSKGKLVQDLDKDYLKIVVLNRYKPSLPTIGFIKNFGIKVGAFASSIAHDSHNIIAVGANDSDLLEAVNRLVDSKGGIVSVKGDDILLQELPIGGIMTDSPLKEVAHKYLQIQDKIKSWGCTLNSPLMTLSFMALLVIPQLKIGDKFLFDGNTFQATNLFVD